MKYVYKVSKWINDGDIVEIPDDAICIGFDVINREDAISLTIIQDRRVHWLQPEENSEGEHPEGENTHPELREGEIFVGNMINFLLLPKNMLSILRGGKQ